MREIKEINLTIFNSPVGIRLAALSSSQVPSVRASAAGYGNHGDLYAAEGNVSMLSRSNGRSAHINDSNSRDALVAKIAGEGRSFWADIIEHCDLASCCQRNACLDC